MVGGSSIGLSESTISFFIFLYVLAGKSDKKSLELKNWILDSESPDAAKFKIISGLPPFVYITFNPTIRKGLIQIAAPNQSMFVSTSIRMTGFSSIHPAISSPARIESSALWSVKQNMPSNHANIYFCSPSLFRTVEWDLNKQNKILLFQQQKHRAWRNLGSSIPALYSNSCLSRCLHSRLSSVSVLHIMPSGNWTGFQYERSRFRNRHFI